VVDSGTEFTSRVFDAWAHQHGIEIHFIRPGRPIENAYVGGFNGKVRDECLNPRRGDLCRVRARAAGPSDPQEAVSDLTGERRLYYREPRFTRVLAWGRGVSEEGESPTAYPLAPVHKSTGARGCEMPQAKPSRALPGA